MKLAQPDVKESVMNQGREAIKRLDLNGLGFRNRLQQYDPLRSEHPFISSRHVHLLKVSFPRTPT